MKVLVRLGMISLALLALLVATVLGFETSGPLYTEVLVLVAWVLAWEAIR